MTSIITRVFCWCVSITTTMLVMMIATRKSLTGTTITTTNKTKNAGYVADDITTTP